MTQPPPPLWTHDEAARATGGRADGAWTASGVSIDSRTVAPGDLFVALKGPSFDGHDYVAAALEAGTAAAMVHRVPAGVDPARLLVVADTLEALQALGRHARARATNARVAGVTGSVGKTGTKEMLTLALSALGSTHATRGNLNNHWGVPLTLARMPADTAFAVIEMGMNHAGEIAVLTRQVRPHVAVITAIASAHMAFFASEAAIADAKAEILEGVEPGGVAVLPRDSRHFRRLARAARAAGVGRTMGFGAHAEADARLLDLASDPGHQRVFMVCDGAPLGYPLGLDGRHWALNSLAVVAALRALVLPGTDVMPAVAALGRMAPLKGRGERREIPMQGGRVRLIDESYNASPVAVTAALETLALARPGPGGRRVAVLGDMLELGPDGAALHAGLAASVLEHGVDLVHTAGPLMAHLHQALPTGRRGAHAPTSAALAPLVTASTRPGDVVMVKGSLGSRMSLVVGALLALAQADARAEDEPAA